MKQRNAVAGGHDDGQTRQHDERRRAADRQRVRPSSTATIVASNAGTSANTLTKVTASGSTGTARDRRRRTRGDARPAAGQHDQDGEAGMGEHDRARSRSQATCSGSPHAASRNRSSTGARPSPAPSSQSRCTNRKATSPIADDPWLVGVQRGAPALGHRREYDERAEQDQRRVAGSRSSAAATPSTYQDAAPALHDGPPILQQHDRPQRHGQDRRAEIRRRHREQRNADHQQHRHGGMRRRRRWRGRARTRTNRS